MTAHQHLLRFISANVRLTETDFHGARSVEIDLMDGQAKLVVMPCDVRKLANVLEAYAIERGI